MGFKDLTDLKGGYDSGTDDDILNDFYIPILQEAVEYKRIAGFFSSSSLSIAARGIAGLINNGGTMKMIVSPRLSPEDVLMMEKATSDPQDIISSVMLRELNDIESMLRKKRVDALGWLMAKGYLQIKVATVYNSNGKLMNEDEIEESGLFHIKVGVLEDSNGDIVTFSGSVNETASAWVRNVEEFKVFKYWEAGQRESAQIDIDKFDQYWRGDSAKVRISDLPEAVSKELVIRAPIEFEKLQEEIIHEESEEKKVSQLTFVPFPYQIEALNVWRKKRRAIFEMATGTGKTKTAEVCINDFFTSEKMPAVVFVVCPQDTLAKQWLEDIKKSGLDWENYVIADSDSPNWKGKLEYSLLSLGVERAGRKERLFVYTTFDTYCSKDFIDLVSKYKMKSKYFIIGDEAHGLGSTQRAKGFLEQYDYRLGLSATPDRWFDEYGTKMVTDFFGEDRYQFTLKQALNTNNPLTGKPYLTQYEYLPRFVTLTDEELIKYNELTRSIIQKLGRAKTDSIIAEKVEQLMFLRADIHKSAVNKYKAFCEILDEIGGEIRDTIIFVSPGQIDEVLSILSQRHIRAHRFSSEEGTAAEKKYGGVSEREHLIQAFKEGDYQALVAMKCLDEGIDIPSAKVGIVLASSTNPREYIQRIGRIIRYSKGKDKAILYDVIVEPSFNGVNPELEKIERKIFRKEMVRINEISDNALNRLDVIDTIYEKLL